MAEKNVAGDTDNELYRKVDGQLHEIKRQMRQRSGCGADFTRLKNALQPVVENTFDTLGHLLHHFIGMVVGLRSDELLHLEYKTIEKNTIVKFGEPLLHNIIVPVQMKDGTYRLVRYHNGESTFVHFLGFFIDELLKEAVEMPIIEHIRDDERYGNLWGVTISNGMCRKQMQFSLDSGAPRFHDYQILPLENHPEAHGSDMFLIKL